MVGEGGAHGMLPLCACNRRCKEGRDDASAAPSFLESYFPVVQGGIQRWFSQVRLWRAWSYLAHNHLRRFAIFVFGRVSKPSRWRGGGRRAWWLAGTPPRSGSPLTGRRSPPIGRAEQQAVLDHGKDSLQKFTQARWPEPTVGSGSGAKGSGAGGWLRSRT